MFQMLCEATAQAVHAQRVNGVMSTQCRTAWLSTDRTTVQQDIQGSFLQIPVGCFSTALSQVAKDGQSDTEEQCTANVKDRGGSLGLPPKSTSVITCASIHFHGTK